MPLFFREQSPFTEEEFGSKLKELSLVPKDIINRLLRSGILVASKKKTYSFHFIGVFAVDDIVGFCYPKFFDSGEMNVDKFKIIVQSIRKCHRDKATQFQLHDGNQGDEYNSVSTELHLLMEYFNNGIYTNSQTFIEDDGSGEIDWDRTINDTLPFIKNNRPYHLTLKTIESKIDDADYIKRLHECVLTKCSENLKKIGMLDLLDMPEAHLYEGEIEDFGPKEYREYRILQELKNQFKTRERELLKTLLAYSRKDTSGYVQDDIRLYGVSNFDHVWECACGVILNNKYIDIKTQIEPWIRKPQWYDLESPVASKGTGLKPDIVSVYKASGKKVFCVLDAKNYLIKIENKKIDEEPGLQDVVKQFVYHKEFLGFIAEENCDQVVNAFLFPKQESCDNLKEDERITTPLENFGRVELPVLMDWGDEWLVPIHLIYLSPSFVVKHFIKNQECLAQLAEIAKLTENREADCRKRIQEVVSKKNAHIIVGEHKNIAFTEEGKIYFFKAKKNGCAFAMHTSLPDCKWIICYHGDGRCEIAKILDDISSFKQGARKFLCKKETLEKDAEINTILDADEYYVFRIEIIKDNLDVQRTDLNRFINEDMNNEFLADCSPKVIVV